MKMILQSFDLVVLSCSSLVGIADCVYSCIGGVRATSTYNRGWKWGTTMPMFKFMYSITLVVYNGNDNGMCLYMWMCMCACVLCIFTISLSRVTVMSATNPTAAAATAAATTAHLLVIYIYLLKTDGRFTKSAHEHNKICWKFLSWFVVETRWTILFLVNSFVIKHIQVLIVSKSWVKFGSAAYY